MKKIIIIGFLCFILTSCDTSVSSINAYKNCLESAAKIYPDSSSDNYAKEQKKCDKLK